MRLINVRDGSFKEFIGTQIPEYAILSHTWEDDEVTYKDVMENVHKRKEGFHKIKMTCQIAASQGIDWAWVDTCCIDKSSSAELTEAINSMYQWYKRAKVCYAYLGDLLGSDDTREALPKCRWFTRGWTLQELVAPHHLEFHDREWNARGQKYGLYSQLETITGIRENILLGYVDLSTVAVAEKMSWAAHRQTTRIEDAAYSLLGIFNVNMPLLYGEEEKAFTRLQEEIIKTTNDRSIFAWKLPPTLESKSEAKDNLLCAVLARSPAAFWERGTLAYEVTSSSKPFSITNSGIEVKAAVALVRESITGKECYVLSTLCRKDSSNRYIMVRLRKVGPDQFLREDPWSFVQVTKAFEVHHHIGSCYLLTRPERSLSTIVWQPTADVSYPMSTVRDALSDLRYNIIQFELPRGTSIRQASPSPTWDGQDEMFFTTHEKSDNFACLNLFHPVIVGGEMRTLAFACFAITCGRNRVQYTMVDYESHEEPLKHLAPLFDEPGYSAEKALKSLHAWKIPRTSGLVYSFPKEKTQVAVSMKPRLHGDANMSGHNVWAFEIVVSLHGKGEAPKYPRRVWRILDDPDHGWFGILVT